MVGGELVNGNVVDEGVRLSGPCVGVAVGVGVGVGLAVGVGLGVGLGLAVGVAVGVGDGVGLAVGEAVGADVADTVTLRLDDCDPAVRPNTVEPTVSGTTVIVDPEMVALATAALTFEPIAKLPPKFAEASVAG